MEPLRLSSRRHGPSPAITHRTHTRKVGMREMVRRRIVNPSERSVSTLINETGVLVSSHDSRIPSEAGRGSDAESKNSSDVENSSDKDCNNNKSSIKIRSCGKDRPNRVDPFAYRPGFARTARSNSRKDEETNSNVKTVKGRCAPERENRKEVPARRCSFLSAFSSSDIKKNGSKPCACNRGLAVPCSACSVPCKIRSARSDSAS